jgi:hypothetical protein
MHELPEGKLIFYYFPTETPQSLAARIESTSFFQNEGWRPFYAGGNGTLNTTNANKSRSVATSEKFRLVAMLISAGKDEYNIDDSSQPGCTVVLATVKVK